jgi:RNA polymerase sigma-70 factor (ECF subfamily)
LNDQEAIRRLKRGDIGGLEWLVHQYQEPALRAAYLIVRDQDSAEDVVQAAFLRLYRAIGSFDATRPFGPWFIRSVVNDALKAAERAERHISLDSGADPPPLPAPDAPLDERLVQAETEAAVWAALGELPPAQRTALVLRYYLDLSEAEMAARLDCPPGTVKSRLHNARVRLRTLLPAWVHERET